MEYQEAVGKLKALKSKAKAARKEGKTEIARGFKSGMQRLERKLRKIPKPVEVVAEAANDEVAEAAVEESAEATAQESTEAATEESTETAAEETSE